MRQSTQALLMILMFSGMLLGRQLGLYTYEPISNNDTLLVLLVLFFYGIQLITQSIENTKD